VEQLRGPHLHSSTDGACTTPQRGHSHPMLLAGSDVHVGEAGLHPPSEAGSGVRYGSPGQKSLCAIMPQP